MNPLNFNPSTYAVGATTPLEQADDGETKVSQNGNTTVTVANAEARTTDGTEVEHNPNEDPETAAKSQRAQQAAHEKRLAEMRAMHIHLEPNYIDSQSHETPGIERSMGRVTVSRDGETRDYDTFVEAQQAADYYDKHGKFPY